MIGKIVVVIFAFVAGAGGAAAYEYASVHIMADQAQPQEGHMLRLEGRFAAVEQRLQEMSLEKDTTDPQVEILVARLNAVEQRLAKLQEQPSKSMAVRPKESADSADGPSSELNSESSAETRKLRISGEDLIAALKDLPEEGVQMIRSAIRREVELSKRQQEKKNPRSELERKAEEGIRKATTALSLTPVQVEQAKEIAAQFIGKIIEVNKIAKERNDPEFARNAKKELEVELRAQVIEILTPEQLDKARDLDPNGIGREYPRGF